MPVVPSRVSSKREIQEVGRLRHEVHQEVELLRRDALSVGTVAYLPAAKAGDEEDAAWIMDEIKALELLDPDASPPVTAGVSPAELEVMREAAARLGAQPGGTGGPGRGRLVRRAVRPVRPAAAR